LERTKTGAKQLTFDGSHEINDYWPTNDTYGLLIYGGNNYITRLYSYKGSNYHFFYKRVRSLQRDVSMVANYYGTVKSKAAYDSWRVAKPTQSPESINTRRSETITSPETGRTGLTATANNYTLSPEAFNLGINTMNDNLRLSALFSAERAKMDAIASEFTSTLSLSVFTGLDFGILVDEALTEAGYTPAQIIWWRKNGTTSPVGLFPFPQAGGTGTSNGGGGGKKIPKVTPPTPAVTKLIVRAPSGYTLPSGQGNNARPHIAQTGSFSEETDRFFFRQIPNTVSYSGLGSKWVEIPRKGDFPIVEWSDWTLMKVQFEFVLAHEGDGLFDDVAADIDQLRRMAQRPLPVSVFGMDQLFAVQMKRAAATGKAMQFVIAEFTVRSLRRTILEGDKEIAAAQCSMTLQEIPIEEMTVVQMSIPPLTGATLPKPPSSDSDEDSSNPLITERPSVVREEGLMAQVTQP
jgi:hypothetical protein